MFTLTKHAYKVGQMGHVDRCACFICHYFVAATNRINIHNKTDSMYHK